MRRSSEVSGGKQDNLFTASRRIKDDKPVRPNSCLLKYMLHTVCLLSIGQLKLKISRSSHSALSPDCTKPYHVACRHRLKNFKFEAGVQHLLAYTTGNNAFKSLWEDKKINI